MTALNFLLVKDMVAISMDTLTIQKTTKTPYKFVSKFCHLPQMNCIICGTGNMGAIIRWIAFVQEKIASNGIYQLDLLTQKSISQFMQNEIVSEDVMTTIYQFGLSEIDNLFHGYAYRSTNGFISEAINYGVGVKPPDIFIRNGALDMQKVNFSIDDIETSFINIMDTQKAYDNTLPISDKIGIGGQIQMILLCKNGAITKTLKEFDDFEDDLKYITNNLS